MARCRTTEDEYAIKCPCGAQWVSNIPYLGYTLAADPPYLLNTRCGKQYRYEMNEQDHVQLLDSLKQHKGGVILSGYPSDMYDRELPGWNRITKKSYNQNADQRTEVLWCNFDVPELLIEGGAVK